MKLQFSRTEFLEITPELGIKIDLKYASTDNFVGENMYGEFNQAFLHKVAFDKFLRAVQMLKAHHPTLQFIVYDALRPRSVQHALWGKVKGTPQQDYVANPENGSMHNFGMALDLSVVDQSGLPLDMGTEFDAFTPLAQPKLEDVFLREGRLTSKQHSNRLILRSAMEAGGFIQLPHEWWHFDALPKAEVKSLYKIVE